MDKDKTCSSCLFFVGGDCRRFPPQSHKILVDNQTQRYEHVWEYPYLTKNFPACSEHKEKEIGPLKT